MGDRTIGSWTFVGIITALSLMFVAHLALQRSAHAQLLEPPAAMSPLEAARLEADMLRLQALEQAAAPVAARVRETVEKYRLDPQAIDQQVNFLTGVIHRPPGVPQP